MDNTTTITLRAQSRSVTVKAPASGYRANPEINQKVSVSNGGAIYTTDFGNETQKLQVQLRRLTRTEYTALKEFILTTCRGSAFSFDLTDYHGTHQNLHYISGLEGAELHRGDLFNVTLQLQKSTDQSIRLEQNLIANPNMTLNSDGTTIDGWDLHEVVPPGTTLRNVAISEDFASSALEITDADSDAEWFASTPSIPITNLRYTISAWINRTAGTAPLFLGVDFRDENGAYIDPQRPTLLPQTGWLARGHFYYFGNVTAGDANNTWKKGSVTFGSGSTTYIPLNARSFQVGALFARTPATARVAGFSVVASP